MKNILRHIRKSLSLKLSISILLLAIPIFIISLQVVFHQSREIISQQAIKRVQSLLNTTSLRAVSYLNTIETATNSNDWLVLEQFQPDSLLYYSRRIVAINSNVDGCSITTEPNIFPEYGRYFSAYTIREGDSIITVKEAEYEYFDKEWYKTPAKLDKACWIDPFDDYNEGTLSAKNIIASYCKSLHDKSGRFIGVISTDLSLFRLSKIIENEKPYPNSYFMMLGEHGHYFIHPDSTRLLDKTIFSEADARQQPAIIALGHEMTTGKKGDMWLTINNTKCLVCYQPMPGTKWSIALVCPENDILKNYYRLTFLILPLLIGGLIIILLFCHRIVKRNTKSLKQLENQTQLISEGHYDIQIPKSHRLDVIGNLQNSFVTMQNSLDGHIRDINQVNKETEKRNKDLQKAKLLAEEAGRRKTAFMQDISHQIRTPLNIIMGFAQVLRDNINDIQIEEVKSITKMMTYNSNSLKRMILMLYDSSDSGISEELKCQKTDQVSCNMIAKESITETLKNFPDTHISFETDVPDTYCIKTSYTYFRRSIREILYNSAKYSDGQHVLLRISKSENKVRFIFEDKGPGIDVAYQKDIFIPFTKVNDLSEGLGLGLPLAIRHIKNLGGSLTFDTTYHEGCRFIIEI